MAISTRRIVLINVTTSPTLDWVKQQIRTIAAFGEGPRYLIHDNDEIFGQFRERQPGRCFRCNFDRWLVGVMCTKGIPIPYGAPNGNARLERFHRTLREAALDLFIFLSEGYVRRVCREFVEYYNRARPSQAIGAIAIHIPSFRSLRRGTGAGRATSSRRTRARRSTGGVGRFANMAVFVNWRRVGGAGLIFIPPCLSWSSLSRRSLTLLPGSSGSTGMGRYGPSHTTSRPSLVDEISAE